jgi:hypothetical protein
MRGKGSSSVHLARSRRGFAGAPLARRSTQRHRSPTTASKLIATPKLADTAPELEHLDLGPPPHWSWSGSIWGLLRASRSGEEVEAGYATAPAAPRPNCPDLLLLRASRSDDELLDSGPPPPSPGLLLLPRDHPSLPPWLRQMPSRSEEMQLLHWHFAPRNASPVGGLKKEAQ